MGKLLNVASHPDSLYRAWRSVRSQLRNTHWPHLTQELDALERSPLLQLRKLQRQLRAGSFHFAPKWGYAKRKSGGSRRGITVHGVMDRIVQRSILDVLQSRRPSVRDALGQIPHLLQTPTIFAGTPDRGVPEAVLMAHRLMQTNANFYAYSDVKDFFPHVPRQDVVDYVAANVEDREFVELFRRSLETALANAADLVPWLHLFPLSDVGVAQGSLLSVFVGNVCLRHFDVALNRPPLTTIRYLDDFLILGPDRTSVADAFQSAKAELARLGMTCYDPGDGSHKAFLGPVAEGFDFLGCHIHRDGISPARRAARKFLRDVKLALSTARRQIAGLGQVDSRRRTEQAYAQTLVQIDHLVRGWGDAYRFVTNRLAFTQLDQQLDQLLQNFHQWVYRRGRDAGLKERRRMSGIALLSDTPPCQLHAPGPAAHQERGLSEDRDSMNDL